MRERTPIIVITLDGASFMESATAISDLVSDPPVMDCPIFDWLHDTSTKLIIISSSVTLDPVLHSLLEIIRTSRRRVKTATSFGPANVLRVQAT